LLKTDIVNVLVRFHVSIVTIVIDIKSRAFARIFIALWEDEEGDSLVLEVLNSQELTLIRWFTKSSFVLEGDNFSSSEVDVKIVYL
jgi:hypothetical protein